MKAHNRSSAVTMDHKSELLVVQCMITILKGVHRLLPPILFKHANRRTQGASNNYFWFYGSPLARFPFIHACMNKVWQTKQNCLATKHCPDAGTQSRSQILV